MGQVLNQLKIDLEEIREHIMFLDSLKSEINATSKSYQYAISSSRKKYDYNSLIISLYGILESYVQKFLIEYLDLIEVSILEYDMLSEKLREHHFQKSLSLINKVLENKYQQYNHLKKESILDNLNGCILKFVPFKINKEAFFINTGNLKHSKTCEIFKGIDINLDSEIRFYDGFKVKSENLFNRQDDLVDRRNEIAHGAVTQIMDNSEIIPLIDYLDVYFNAIDKLLEDRANLEINTFKKNKYAKEITNSTVYKGNIVGILEGAKLNISLNSEVFIEKANEKIVMASIIDVRNFTPSSDITIKIDKNIRDNCKFYLYDKLSYDNAKNHIS